MVSISFILNPVAGMGVALSSFAIVEDELIRKGIDYEVKKSTRPYEATELAREAAAGGAELVVAVGGDGTMREVAAGVVGTDSVLGLLPFGRGNDMARALGLPTEPLAALNALLNAPTLAMDAGKMNGEYFFNVAGAGFDVDVLVQAEKYRQNNVKGNRYLRAVLSVMSHMKPMKMKIVLDDEAFELDTLMIDVANGTHIGGGMNVAPNASPFDGQFDICIIKKVSLLGFLFLLPKFTKGKHLTKKCVISTRSKHITVECSEHKPLQMDGEVGNSLPFTAEIIEGALKVRAYAKAGTVAAEEGVCASL